MSCPRPHTQKLLKFKSNPGQLSYTFSAFFIVLTSLPQLSVRHICHWFPSPLNVLMQCNFPSFNSMSYLQVTSPPPQAQSECQTSFVPYRKSVTYPTSTFLTDAQPLNIDFYEVVTSVFFTVLPTYMSFLMQIEAFAREHAHFVFLLSGQPSPYNNHMWPHLVASLDETHL